MFLLLLVIVFALALGGGGWGYSRWGYAGMSPAAAILVVVGILYFTGNLHLR